MLSASGLDRAAACPASEALPASFRTTEWAQLGRVLHKYLQDCQSDGPDKALESVPEEYRDACALIDVSELPVGGEYAAEVAFALDVKTGTARELGRGINRRYVVSDSEIPGTMDVVGLAVEAVFVDDFKTGHSEQPDAKDSRQIKFGVLCAMRVYDKPIGFGRIIRVGADDDHHFSRARFDSFDMAIFAKELADIRARVLDAQAVVESGRTPSVTEGSHCRWCPALYTCPAKVELVRSLATVDDAAITSATASEAWRRLKRAEEALGLVKKRIYELARSRPIPLGDGEYLGEVTKPGNERLDGDGTYMAVAAMLGNEAAEIAAPAERKATKKALTAAVRHARDAGVVKKIAPVERAILETLRESGCARAPLVTKVATYSGPTCINDGCDEQALSPGSTCNSCAIDAEFKEIA